MLKMSQMPYSNPKTDPKLVHPYVDKEPDDGADRRAEAEVKAAESRIEPPLICA